MLLLLFCFCLHLAGTASTLSQVQEVVGAVAQVIGALVTHPKVCLWLVHSWNSVTRKSLIFPSQFIRSNCCIGLFRCQKFWSQVIEFCLYQSELRSWLFFPRFFNGIFEFYIVNTALLAALLFGLCCSCEFPGHLWIGALVETVWSEYSALESPISESLGFFWSLEVAHVLGPAWGFLRTSKSLRFARRHAFLEHTSILALTLRGLLKNSCSGFWVG